MDKHKLAALGFCAVMITPLSSWAAPSVDSLLAGASLVQPQGGLTLSDALALTRLHHPSLRSLAWRVRAAEGRRKDAGRLPNPSLSVEIENVGGSLGSDHAEKTIRAEQILELGGKGGARQELASAQRDLAFTELSREERSVLGTTAERFLEAWTQQERARQLARAERLAQQAIGAAEERHRAGAGPAFERTRAQAAYALRQAERQRASSALASAAHRLVAQWGSTVVEFDSLVLEPVSLASIPPSASMEALVQAHPERLQAVAEVAVEQARVREARAARVPDLSVQAGARHLADADGTGMVFGISTALPLWNRRRGAVAAAEAEHFAAQSRQQLVTARLNQELRAAHERLMAAADAHEILRTRVRPNYEDVLRQVASGYRAGRFNSLELLEAQRALVESELALIEARADAWRARQELERMVGIPLDDVDRPREGR